MRELMNRWKSIKINVQKNSIYEGEEGKGDTLLIGLKCSLIVADIDTSKYSNNTAWLCKSKLFKKLATFYFIECCMYMRQSASAILYSNGRRVIGVVNIIQLIKVLF